MLELLLLAADEIPPSNPLAQLATPLGIIFFLGSTYMLLRSNLGTSRAYYVLATSLFGFLFLMSMFWGFGAPGTPQATGPTNLPGQPADALQAKWIPFAQDSLLADRGDLSVVKGYPEGFEVDGWSEDQQDNIDQGLNDIVNFFSTEAAGRKVAATWPVETVAYTETTTGFPLIAAEFTPVDDALEPTGDDPYVAFAYYDAGNPLLPSLIFIVISLILFVLHAWLLDRSERMERREIEAVRGGAPAESERVPANA